MGTAFSGVASARPLPVTGGRVRRGIPVLAALHGLGYALLVPFIFFICFTFLRPSPYDFFAIPAMALWFCLGIRLHRGWSSSSRCCCSIILGFCSRSCPISKSRDRWSGATSPPT